MATRQTTDFPAGGILTDTMLDNEFNEIYTNITDTNIAAGANIAISKTTLGTYTPWTSYSPTWTGASSNPSIGNGTLSARYTQIGKLVTYTIYLTTGSTTSYGSGGWSFSLPVTAASTILDIGQAYASNVSEAQPYVLGVAVLPTTTTVSAYSENSSAFWQSVVPFVPATGDFYRITINYEAA